MPRQSKNKQKIILGLTGTFGSGKTTVSRILRSYGAEIIDADRIAHRVLLKGTPAYRRLLRVFGNEILNKDLAINRRRLAEAVFGNRAFLKKLNKIVHPQVIALIKKRIKNSSSKVVVLDAPLLIEAGLASYVDKLIVVKINRKEQIRRLKKKFSCEKEDILKRIRAQMPLQEKIRIADFIIDNSATLRQTKKQVRKIRRLLWKN